MHRRLVTLASTIALFSASPAQPQTLITHPAAPNVVVLEVNHPFVRDGDLSVLSFAGFITSRSTVGRGTLVAELPFSMMGDGNEWYPALGGLYFGGELPAAGIVVVAGLRLPTNAGDQEAGYLGSLTDFNRLEAFYTNAISLRGGLANRPNYSNGTHIGWHATIVSSRRRSELSDGVTQGSYGFGVDHRTEAGSAGADLSGRILLSDAGGSDLAARTIHALSLRADFGKGTLRPGIAVRFPLDQDIREDVPAVLSVRMQVVRP